MPRAMRRPVILVLAALTVCLLCVAPASAQQDTVTSGQVTATFSYDKTGDYEFWDLWLTVDRAGATVYDEPLDISTCEEPYCIPGPEFFDGSGGLKVRDLDGDAEPEVIADVFTGGAHCCVASEILRWDGSRYRASERNWADVGYRLTDTDSDGIPEFKTADARFAYQFSSFADSRFPLRILSYRAGTFTDTTRAHRALIRDDAKRLRREYRRRRGNGYSLGVLAAWTADQYLLGNRRAANRFLRQENRAGMLRGDIISGSGSRYIRRLKRKLRRWGY